MPTKVSGPKVSRTRRVRPVTTSPVPGPIASAPRLGGAVGAHGHAGGRWFDPGPWAFAIATFVWVIAMARQSRCQPAADGTQVNPMARLCYSDVPVIFTNSGLLHGQLPFLQTTVSLPVFTGALAGLAAWAVGLFIPLSTSIDAAAAGRASNLFTVFTSIGLFIAFVMVVGSHLLMGRESSRGVVVTEHGSEGTRLRSWDALYVAAALPVLLAGMINWDLWGAGLTAVAMLAWAQGRLIPAGVLFGLAISSAGYPLLVVVALAFLCWRADKMGAWATTGIATVATWTLINVPLAITNWTSWSTWIRDQFARQADLGSFWYILERFGIHIPLERYLSAFLFFLVVIAVAILVQRAPTRPRVPQVAFLLVLGFLVTGQVYSPQYVVWLFPLLMLARPVRFDWLVFSLSEGVYWWVVWVYLNGDLGNGADQFYAVVIIQRLVVEVWMGLHVVSDMLHPWHDPVRIPHVDDPSGGVLDHAPDAMVRS